MTAIPAEVEITATQFPAEAIAGRTFDILIVGAGPAGSAAAITLCRQGFSVALVDRAQFPREKICGDCLLPEAMTYLEQLGVADTIRRHGHPVSALSIFSCSGLHFEIPADILTLRRTIFDTLLARAAVETGVVFCLGSVTGIESEKQTLSRIRLGNCRRPVFARIVLIATGAGTSLPTRIGLTDSPVPSAVASRCYVRSTVQLTTGVLSYDRSVKPGFAWIFPLGGNLFNIGCGTVTKAGSIGGQYLRKSFERFVTNFPPAAELLRHGKIETSLRGFPIQSALRQPSSSTHSRILAIGESIGTTYPFSGEGIAPAIRSAFIASDLVAQALRSGDTDILGNYSHRLRNELGALHRGYGKAERWLSVGWLNDLAAARIGKSPRLQKLCSGIVAGAANPSEVYSLRGLLTSLWS